MPTMVPTEVALVCPRQQAPKPGQEVTINYGDKGNEMLLMSYGTCLGTQSVSTYAVFCMAVIYRAVLPADWLALPTCCGVS